MEEKRFLDKAGLKKYHDLISQVVENNKSSIDKTVEKIVPSVETSTETLIFGISSK